MGLKPAAMKSTEEYSQEIASTRGQIERDAEALRNRMSARELVRPITDRVRGTLGEGGEKILEAFRENPIPLGLVGIGLGWLMLRDRPGYRSREFREGAGTNRLRTMSEGAKEAVQEAGHMAGAASEKVGDTVNSMVEGLSNAAGTVAEAVSGMVHGAGDMAGAVSEKVGEVASTVSEKVGRMARRARGATKMKTGQTSDWATRTLDENPFVLAVSAMAVGMLAGLLLPTTEAEESLMESATPSATQKKPESDVRPSAEVPEVGFAPAAVPGKQEGNPAVTGDAGAASTGTGQVEPPAESHT